MGDPADRVELRVFKGIRHNRKIPVQHVDTEHGVKIYKINDRDSEFIVESPRGNQVLLSCSIEAARRDAAMVANN